MTTCNAIREELVAYCDGELPEQERESIAAHLATCVACTQEAAQVHQMQALLVQVEKFTRIEPSADFAATFWQRLEQEQQHVHAVVLNKPRVVEGRLPQWWKELRTVFTSWQIAPMLAAAASVLVFFSYMTLPTRTRTPAAAGKTTPPAATSTTATKAAPTAAPAGLVENLNFFLQYPIIADLDRFSHFEEIAAIDLSKEKDTALAKEEELPPDLLQNPGFFAHYPMLKKMDQLQHLEAVLDAPTQEQKRNQG